jgi:hypothetical protein
MPDRHAHRESITEIHARQFGCSSPDEQEIAGGEGALKSSVRAALGSVTNACSYRRPTDHRRAGGAEALAGHAYLALAGSQALRRGLRSSRFRLQAKAETRPLGWRCVCPGRCDGMLR